MNCQSLSEFSTTLRHLLAKVDHVPFFLYRELEAAKERIAALKAEVSTIMGASLLQICNKTGELLSIPYKFDAKESKFACLSAIEAMKIILSE